MTEQRSAQGLRWAVGVVALAVLLGVVLFFVYGGATRPQLGTASRAPTTQTA